MKNKTKNTKESIITRNKTIFAIQLIVGLFTVGYIYYTGLLPLKYNIIIAVILLGAIAISGVVLFKSRGWFNNFVKITNMALSLVLVIGQVSMQVKVYRSLMQLPVRNMKRMWYQ
ncbi:hypothetical protein MGH68_17275 [Erysipelothrix sp. D19-032]